MSHSVPLTGKQPRAILAGVLAFLLSIVSSAMTPPASGEASQRPAP